MILTSYCNVEPIATELRNTRRSMSIQDQVDIEDALQRWGHLGPEKGHIYHTVGLRVQVLARNIVDTGRFLVGVHSLVDNEIVVVSMNTGPINSAVRPAFLYLGPVASSPNPNWTG